MILVATNGGGTFPLILFYPTIPVTLTNMFNNNNIYPPSFLAAVLVRIIVNKTLPLRDRFLFTRLS